MTLYLAPLFLLTTLLASLLWLVERTRARNLQILLQFEREQFTDLSYALDDATRELEHVRHLHASLLEENTTLCVDLMHAERDASFCRSVRRRRRDHLAGWVVLNDGAQVDGCAHVNMIGSKP